ncbi:unnamed protein product, partial [Acanthoscelides obtectus]
RPSPLQNCTVSNQTALGGFQVECVEGFDGGLPQSFVMEVVEIPGLRPRLNLTTYRAPPAFSVAGLEPGRAYRIALYAVNAKGRSEPTLIDPVTFKGVAKLQGSSMVVPANPLLLGLLGAAALLATGVCLVLAALCRRRLQRHPHRRSTASLGSDSTCTTKHVPMEAIIATEDMQLTNSGGAVSGGRSPMSPTAGSGRIALGSDTAIKLRAVDGADPDIIKNQYERRPLHSFIKVYEPRRTREEEDLEEDTEPDFDSFRQHLAKDSALHTTHNPSNHMVYRSLQRPNSQRHPISGLSGAQTLTHKYRGPEVVTTTNRIQESCI